MINIRQELNLTALNAQLSGPSGSVTRDMLDRGRHVQSRARELAKANHGVLRNSIMIGTRQGTHGSLVVIVGTTMKYATWVHEGTGIYGSAGSPIVPRHASVLRFTGKDGKIHFAPSVKGQPGVPFLKEALAAYKT